MGIGIDPVDITQPARQIIQKQRTRRKPSKAKPSEAKQSQEMEKRHVEEKRGAAERMERVVWDDDGDSHTYFIPDLKITVFNDKSADPAVKELVLLFDMLAVEPYIVVGPLPPPGYL